MGFDEVFKEFFDDSAEIVFFLGGETDSLHGGPCVVHVRQFFGGNSGSFVDRGHKVNAVPGLAEVQLDSFFKFSLFSSEHWHDMNTRCTDSVYMH